MRLLSGLPARVRLRSVARQISTVLVAAILLLCIYAVARAILPEVDVGDLASVGHRFVGPAWPFFAAVLLYLAYVSAAWVSEVTHLTTARPDWTGFARVLHWATEACPLVGLLTTFLSLLQALLAYGEAGGPGNPDVQAAFIRNFAVAFGSSIAGGTLALLSFTLLRIIVDE